MQFSRAWETLHPDKTVEDDRLKTGLEVHHGGRDVPPSTWLWIGQADIAPPPFGSDIETQGEALPH